jgi:hypothetical protein
VVCARPRTCTLALAGRHVMIARRHVALCVNVSSWRRHLCRVGRTRVRDGTTRRWGWDEGRGVVALTHRCHDGMSDDCQCTIPSESESSCRVGRGRGESKTRVRTGHHCVNASSRRRRRVVLNQAGARAGTRRGCVDVSSPSRQYIVAFRFISFHTRDPLDWCGLDCWHPGFTICPWGRDERG